MMDLLKQLKLQLQQMGADLSSHAWLIIGLALGLVITLGSVGLLTEDSGGMVASGQGTTLQLAAAAPKSSKQVDEHETEGHSGHDHEAHAGEDAHAHDDDHGDGGRNDDEHVGEAGHDDHGHTGNGHEEDFERGANGGRLLKSDAGPLSLEITIYEAGQSPQFRVYAYISDEAIDPSSVDLSIELGRLGGKTDRFKFNREGAYLAGDGDVVEPHSFDVAVKAKHAGQSYSWAYASYEGRTEISKAAAGRAGVATARTGPAVLTEIVDALGRIKFAPGAKATLRARFPGPVVDVLKTVGDKVEKGEALVRVESNESMQAYDVVSPMDGIVLERLSNPGDLAGSEPLMVVGDLRRLHVDFHIFASDQDRVRPGQDVEISAVNGPMKTMAKIATILPTREAATQTIIARADLANVEGAWMPGMTAKGKIVVAKQKVPLAVRTKALQRFRDFTVIFAKVGNTYEVRMLELGRRTPEWTEVLSGVGPGQEYVVENSFLIKADIEKSGASHDH